MKDRRGLLLLLSVLGAEANILHNGDFQSGSVAPWRCVGCHCDSSDKYLGRTSDFHIELKKTLISLKNKIFTISSGTREDRKLGRTPAEPGVRDLCDGTFPLPAQLQPPGGQRGGGEAGGDPARGEGAGGEVHLSVQ